MKKSRRRFLKVVAAGAAAAMAAPASAFAATARPAKRAAKSAKPAAKPAPGPDAVHATEIARQKASVAQALKVLREFPLENGVEQAFVFQPLRAPREGR
jgi:anaerobic selenocysteine-containing dehydrogenase